MVIGSHRQLGDLLTKAQFVAQVFALQCCDQVICNSRAAADALVEGGLSRHRIAVIGNGLPISAFSNPDPALPRQPGLRRVGMIARMNHEYKGHEQFLRMAAMLVAGFDDLEFVLAGDGPLRSKLEALANDLGIAGRVRFLGDRSDITEEIARLRSHIEQFRVSINGGGEVGKRLDFLLQELNREANTVLSKSTEITIKDAGLVIKAEVEKLREQVQNVE